MDILDLTVKAVIKLNDPLILIRFLLIAWGVWKFRNLKLL